MFKKIISVKVKDNFFIVAEFSTGEIKEYDIKHLFNEIEIFKDLEEIEGLFEQVRIDTGGYGIIWNDYIDLSSDEIYYNGKNIGK